MTRKDTILKLIVQSFIKNAEPVASKTLVENYNLNFSSATIRAEMNKLEKDGFLEKTHTSSGRVPSQKGYEYYLLNLRENKINNEIKNRLQNVIDQKIASIETVIRESCEILANMTNLVVSVTTIHINEERLANIQFIPISNNSAIAILVTDKGYVENKTFILPKNVNIENIASCIKLFNDRLKGTPIKLLIKKIKTIKPLLSDHIINYNVIYRALFEVIFKLANERLKLYGKEEILKQSNFKYSANQLKKIFELIDHPDELKKKILDTIHVNNNVNVYVADQKKIDDISILAAPISFGTNDVYLTLLGPPRIDYDKAINMLDYVSNTVNKHFKILLEDHDSKENKNGRKQKRRKK